ncbi:hypothetical protein RVR_6592 [Actinacidiphila reveromycinica]|uniref:Uncharacterized protein n=1 Tax=Actinacidiphila reveromycinica TaxID=659352 RepID=A0A7U3UW07_9ACTN|nr:hypothetical protein [Streptomyces sp. SN-593]BBA99809.1 hypothetical protein RVR_6592 [Streptomyces sp. SN-593]
MSPRFPAGPGVIALTVLAAGAVTALSGCGGHAAAHAAGTTPHTPPPAASAPVHAEAPSGARG